MSYSRKCVEISYSHRNGHHVVHRVGCELYIHHPSIWRLRLRARRWKPPALSSNHSYRNSCCRCRTLGHRRRHLHLTEIHRSYLPGPSLVPMTGCHTGRRLGHPSDWDSAAVAYNKEKTERVSACHLTLKKLLNYQFSDVLLNYNFHNQSQCCCTTNML